MYPHPARVAQGLSLSLVTFLAACSAPSVSASEPGMPPSDEAAITPLSADERDARLAALRETHVVANEFDSCARDTQCDAPLRCPGGECRFPDAMVGNVSETAPRVVIHTDNGPARFFVELATTPDEQARGLMFRRHMDPDWGMLFVFPQERLQSFWMKNTFLPLDMIFVRADGVIDSIVENAVPLSLEPRASRGRAKYVLELAGGEAARRGIAYGQKIDLNGL